MSALPTNIDIYSYGIDVPTLLLVFKTNTHCYFSMEILEKLMTSIALQNLSIYNKLGRFAITIYLKLKIEMVLT